MVSAIADVPIGVTARGSVTVIELAPVPDHYQRFHSIVLAERDTHGRLHGALAGIAARVLTHFDPVAGRPCTAVDFREVAP